MPRLTFLLIAAASLILSDRASAEDWTQFRGSTGQGISNAKNVPTEWDTSKNLTWKIEIPGSGWSSPVVSDGKIYLTTAIAKPKPSLRALCLDANTGKILWDEEIFHPAEQAFRTKHEKNSPASSTSIVTKDRLFVHFGHLGTAALDLSGKVIWRQESIKYPPVHGNGGSPALVGDVLVFNCDGASNPFIIALDAKTGEIRWKTPRNTHAKSQFSFSTPLAIEVDGVTQVVSPASGIVGAYDPKTGREIWRVDYGQGYSVVPRPVYAHGLIVVSSSYNNAVLYAIRPKGAKGDATEKHVAWTNRKSAPNTPSPVVVGDEIYFVSDAGIASCADLKSGKVHWDERLDGNFSSSLVAVGDHVYFQSEEGIGYVVRASKEFELISENDLAERSLASYAVVDGALFIRTEKHLWKIAGSEK